MPIKKIVVVGGGTAGWMAASALSRYLKKEQYTIVLIESEQIGTVGVGEATLPLIRQFNDALGIDENEFMRETNATFKLGIEFVNWGSIDSKYFHPFGRMGAEMEGIDFAHFWLRWRSEGGNLDFSHFSVESKAAKANKFTRTREISENRHLPHVNYAFHFDANAYAAYLRRFAEKNGVQRVEGMIDKIELDPLSGDIQTLHLVGGDCVSGELFVDCSGFRGLLINGALKVNFVDWSHWLPVNSAVAVPSEKTSPVLPYTRSTAKAFGWQWRIPLQHRTGNGYVYSDKFINDQEASSELLTCLDSPALASPRVIKFTTGMREKCWEKNCVALGLASGFLEPLESTSIHLVQVGIAMLLRVFPENEINPKLVDRFNQEMRDEYTDIKDFLIAHYKITQREDTEFWRYVKNMQVPDSLQNKLEFFKERGDVVTMPKELFTETSWFSVLVGQGLYPNSYHPMANSLSKEELKNRMIQIYSAIGQRVQSMPHHEQFIAKWCSSTLV